MFVDEMFVDEMLCRRNVVSTKNFRQNACRRSAVSTKCRVDENFSTIICRPNACRQKFVDQQHIYRIIGQAHISLYVNKIEDFALNHNRIVSEFTIV
jgi:hypothetical protein